MTPLARISAVEHGAAKVHCQLKLREDGNRWADIADESREIEAAILQSLAADPRFIGDVICWTDSRAVTAWQRLRNLGLIEPCHEGWKAKE